MYLSHNQGRALGNTSGSPYNSQSERALNNNNNNTALHTFAINEFSKHVTCTCCRCLYWFRK